MSAHVMLGVVEGPEDRLAHQTAEGHVPAAGLVVGLADPDDGARRMSHHVALQDADEVLLQARARGRVGQGPVAAGRP